MPGVLATLEERRILTFGVAMDPGSFTRTSRIAGRSPWVVPAFGIHPWRAADHAADLAALDPFIARAPMLGEVGLDFHWVDDTATYPAQRQVFDYFVAAARREGKILNVHTKGAEREILAALDPDVARRTIIHWYSGPPDLLDGFFDLGASFTVGVEVLHSDPIRRIARAIPLELLLVETDSPGGEQFLDGTRGTPAAITRVIDHLAALRDTTPHDLATAIRANILRLMGDDPRLQRWRDLLDGNADP